MATLFQPNPRSEVRIKDANEQTFKYRILETRGHGTTPLRVKEVIEDVSSELDNGGQRRELFCFGRQLSEHRVAWGEVSYEPNRNLKSQISLVQGVYEIPAHWRVQDETADDSVKKASVFQTSHLSPLNMTPSGQFLGRRSVPTLFKNQGFNRFVNDTKDEEINCCDVSSHFPSCLCLRALPSYQCRTRLSAVCSA
ncbi:hypothetical protein TNCV_622661 [Trichonephila clavipes]|nr:hypothetical protein TNCV_622661 [Trichonephila clavipes]